MIFFFLGLFCPLWFAFKQSRVQVTSVNQECMQSSATSFVEKWDIWKSLLLFLIGTYLISCDLAFLFYHLSQRGCEKCCHSHPSELDRKRFLWVLSNHCKWGFCQPSELIQMMYCSLLWVSKLAISHVAAQIRAAQYRRGKGEMQKSIILPVGLLMLMYFKVEMSLSSPSQGGQVWVPKALCCRCPDVSPWLKSLVILCKIYTVLLLTLPSFNTVFHSREVLRNWGGFLCVCVCCWFILLFVCFALFCCCYFSSQKGCLKNLVLKWELDRLVKPKNMGYISLKLRYFPHSQENSKNNQSIVQGDAKLHWNPMNVLNYPLILEYCL